MSSTFQISSTALGHFLAPDYDR